MASLADLQPQLVAQFKRVIAANRLSAAYLFEGALGTGKAKMAQWLAMRLFCLNVQDGAPCRECAECTRVLTGNHPDVVWLATDDKSLKVDAVRELKAEMSKTGVEGMQRVFIIREADKLTTAAANSLLKFYEEPVAGMTIILTTTAKNRILPTILSRAQIVHFPPLAVATVQKQVEEAGVAPRLAAIAAHLTASVPAAIELAENASFAAQVDAVLALVAKLAARDDEAFVQVQTSVLAVAKNPAEQGQFLTMLGLAYADALNAHYGVSAPSAFGTVPALTALQNHSGRQLSAGLQDVLTAQQQVAQNVTFQAAVEQLILKRLEG